MFPPSNSYNDFSSTMAGSSFAVDKSSAVSSQDEPTPPFWQFPAHFIDDDDGLLMSHLLSQAHQQILSSTTIMAPLESEINPASPIKETKKVVPKRKISAGSNGAKQRIPRKRAGKKDRHSKIYTAHGPRDRRMRLSLQIARKFFDLQDILGFDKASKTIEWLFSKSKAAIKDLTDKYNLPGVEHSCSTGGGKSASSTSESEVVSAAKEGEDNTRRQQQGNVVARVASAREAKERKSRKASFNPIARESRDKARARARERTIEKMKVRGLQKSNKCSDESNPNELERLESSTSPLETAKNLGASTPKEGEKVQQPSDHHQSSVRMLEHEMDSVSIIEKFLGISRSAPGSSSSMFSYSHNIADSSGENSEETCPIILSGNWSMSNDRIRYGYRTAMTNIKESTGNAQAQDQQNPSTIFMTDPTQDQNPSSNLMVNSFARIVSHNSDLLTPSNSSNTYEGSPTSILIMPTSDIAALHSQYQEKPIVASRYRNFY